MTFALQPSLDRLNAPKGQAHQRYGSFAITRYFLSDRKDKPSFPIIHYITLEWKLQENFGFYFKLYVDFPFLLFAFLLLIFNGGCSHLAVEDTGEVMWVDADPLGYLVYGEGGIGKQIAGVADPYAGKVGIG